jgi:aryl-alcohol dehydrogenase-like predicted oxidoreductase
LLPLTRGKAHAYRQTRPPRGLPHRSRGDGDVARLHRCGFLTGTLRSPADIERLDDDDFRKNNPRFTGENFQRNLRLADDVQTVAEQLGATAAQVALAWLLTKGNDIAPIPGTKRVSRVEENTGADAIELTPEQIATLDAMAPAEGGHHTDAQMQMIER